MRQKKYLPSNYMKSVYNHNYGRVLTTGGGGGGGGGGSGDVVGPASATDNAIPRYDGTTGKLIQNTVNFTCDDNANVKIGDSTSNVDRVIHCQSKQDVVLFLEGDTDNVTESDNPKIVLQQDGNLIYSSMSLKQDGVALNNVLVFDTAISTSAPIPLADQTNMVFRIGGQYVTPATGNRVTSFTLEPTEVMRLDNEDKKVKIAVGLKTDLIEEITSDNGVDIDSVNFRDGTINLTTAASNPGGVNTLWQRTSDGHLLRGVVDLEDTGGDFFGPASSLDKSLVGFDGTTGKLGANTTIIANTESTNMRLQVEPGVLGYGSANTILGHRNLVKSNGTNTNFNTSVGNNIFLTGAASVSTVPISSNVFLGNNVCQNAEATAGSFSQNVLIGQSVCQNAASTATGATFVGNIVIGDGAGSNLTDNSDYNILIDNNGVDQESNTIRIGNNTDHTKAYISGIHSVMEPATNSARPVAISSDGQLTRYMMPMGELSFSDFVTPILLPLPLQNTAYEMSIPGLTFTTNKLQKFSTPSAGRIQWDGDYSIYLHTAISFSIEVNANNEIIELQYRKNGVVLPGGSCRNKFGSGGEYQSYAQHLLIQVDPGDYISIWAINTT